MQNLFLEPMPQQPVDLLLEIVSRREIMKSGLKMALFGDEPSIEESFQTLPLVVNLRRGRVVEPHRGRFGVAEHENIGKRIFPSRGDGGQDFVGGAARIGAAVGLTRETGRQLGAEAAAKDRQHHVAFGRGRDLRLKGGMGLIEFGFPADRFEADDPGEFAVETLDDAVDAAAFMIDIAGRRHKDAKMLHCSSQDARKRTVYTCCAVC
ncbi:MAG TPA: hypothetical protein VG651_08315 [Stellaceae bacterium]|nr:hypothetical protein [Stellaceae bacterium]